MWKKDKQTISSGDYSINVIAARDVNLRFERSAPTEWFDEKIEGEVAKLRQSRFFLEFDRISSAQRLGRRLAEGDLAGGSDASRNRGLAWCARVLAPSEHLGSAEECLGLARTLGDSEEAKIAGAFIDSGKRDKPAALRALSVLNSDASRSASLMIVALHDGPERALQWLTATGRAADHLDPDGKGFLLRLQLQLGYWDDATQTVRTLSAPDFDESPLLHHLTAITKLASAVPFEFRSAILRQVPFEARDFPLASDTTSVSARRTAHGHFLDASVAAMRLTCPRAARADDEYALWLELRDPEHSKQGMTRLEDKLRDPDAALGVVHFALQFGIKLDLGAVERDIERSIARNGGMTDDAAIARFALALARSTPEAVADYIARHHSQLAAHIDSTLMRSRQIEMLSRAGLIERANYLLDELIGEGLPAEQASSLRSVISEAHSSDPVESRKARYRVTGALSDLINLVAALEDQKQWDSVCEFGRLLFQETHSLNDAERLVRAYNETRRSAEVVRFLSEHADLLSQSKRLRMSYAWGLYHEGAFIESRAALEALSDEVSSPNYRALVIKLGIATGDWASLSAYVAAEYQSRHAKSAQELISVARLAFQLGSTQAKDLVFEAAGKANDDPVVLATAYTIAASAGWEGDPSVVQWLERAAQLSGEDGPLKRISLKELLDRRPEWDRLELETWRVLARGEMPVFVAAQCVNRSLIDLTTFPALANLSERDPRRRRAIPAYSGRRVPAEVGVDGKNVALDATALLTLSFLEILDVTLDAFTTVHVPHSALWWLFEERQRAAFHQPSRIAGAHKVRDYLATDSLEKFVPSTPASSDLADQVGDDLAALIAEAEKVRDGDDSQHLVVRPAPILRRSSLMEEEADLTEHAVVLSSCLAVVKKLRLKGKITADEERRARAYLQLHEKPWPGQPDIADGAILYLDELALNYLLHLGMLGKLKAAGLRAVASPSAVSEADALISYERISEEVQDVIERIRASLSSRIGSRKVKFGRVHWLDESGESPISKHPSASIVALAPVCDIAIIDDRFINQHANIGSGNAQAPVVSTLDVLDALAAIGVLSEGDRLEYRTRLRRAGYLFVPVSANELERCLRDSAVADGHVVETAELRAIRESVLRVRMSDWLRLPEEAPWLDGTIKAFVGVLKNLWKDGSDIEEISIRSDWLIQQIDVRGWAHSFVPENAENVVRIGRAAHILFLLAPPVDVPPHVADAYWNWVEERILRPTQEQFPEAYDWLVDWYRTQIAEMAESPLSGGEHP